MTMRTRSPLGSHSYLEEADMVEFSLLTCQSLDVGRTHSLLAMETIQVH